MIERIKTEETRNVFGSDSQKMMKTLGFTFGFILLVSSEAASQTLRVHLLERAAHVRLTSNKPILAQTVSGRLVSHALLREMHLSPMHGVAINGARTFEESVLVIPQDGATLFLNGTPYAGSFRISANAKSLSVVNLVDIEEYLEGVVPAEMPQDWPMEALKAQAVISRTYALYQAKKNSHKKYDLVASVLSQVYKGKSGFYPRAHQAITQTQGIAATYNGSWALTFFHSTSAGHTEDARDVWGIDLPYLKGVSCPFDRPSPHFQWTRTLSLSDIEQAMAKQGVGTIATVAPLKYSKAGRILILRILHKHGETILKGEDLRRLIGYRTLPSTNFQIESFGETLSIRGRGFGHGVGLCQWGAKALAERGFTFDEIISYYYPGVSLL